MSRVLITGCSTGIGRATATELAERGYDVVATARRPETLSDLDVAQRLPLDVVDDDSVQSAVEAAVPIDVLVNNAAFGVIGPIETIPLDQVRAMYETNVFGVLRMLQAVLPGMRERGRGTVVNISSLAGRMASMPLNGLYASTKHALEAITETLYYEMRRFHIRVVAVEPGWTATAWAGNERWLGVDEPPYDELYGYIKALDEEGLEDAASPQDVTAVIVEAIESDDPPLRMPVGEEGKEVVKTRRQLDDHEWEQLVDEHRSFTW